MSLGPINARPQPSRAWRWGKRIMLLVSLTAGMLLLAALVRINLWSLAYVQVLAGGARAAELAAPPMFHRSGVRWQAELALAQGRPQAALALLAGQDDPLALHTRGKVHSARGEVLQALAVWAQADDGQSIQTLAHALETDGRFGEAETAYRALVEIDAGAGVLEAARFFSRTGRQPEAKEWLRRALQAEPASPYAKQWARQLAAWEAQ